MENLIDIGQLSEILGIGRQTAVNKISQDPTSLPPFIRIGPKLLRWQPSTVKSWLLEQEEKGRQEVESRVEKRRKKRGRGRPSKKEMMAARA